MHCGVSAVRCLCSFFDRLRPADTDTLPCLSADREIRNDNLQVTVTFIKNINQKRNKLWDFQLLIQS